MTCNELVYLLDLKSHMSNKPKCVGGKAILQSNYIEMLTNVVLILEGTKEEELACFLNCL